MIFACFIAMPPKSPPILPKPVVQIFFRINCINLPRWFREKSSHPQNIWIYDPNCVYIYMGCVCIYIHVCVYMYMCGIYAYIKILYIYTCMGYVHGIYIYTVYVWDIYMGYIYNLCMHVWKCNVMLYNVM